MFSLEKELISASKKAHEETLNNWNDEDWDNENNELEYNEDQEEIIEEEEISENELLAIMDRQQDPFEVCKEIFDKEKLFNNDNNSILVEPNLTHKDLQTLYEKGFVVVDGFIEKEEAVEVYNLAKELSHTFKPACDLKKSEIEAQNDIFRDNTARSDLIRWLHPKEFIFSESNEEVKENRQTCHCYVSYEEDYKYKQNETMRRIVLNKFKVIQQTLNEYAPCVSNLDSSMELMWSLYKNHGAYYEKHRDAFPSNGKEEVDLRQRKVTAILYLNVEWENENDGGQLRVFAKPENSNSHTERIPIEINPLACRLVLFLSGALDHEVLPSYKDRVALTCWYS
ncbi:hypothetical protein ABK040_005244 [Willaertia magna]